MIKISISTLLLISSLAHAIDRDGNGMCDVWQARFGVNAANIDSDGDGVVNSEEETAGTDPLSSASRFTVKSIAANSNVIVSTTPVVGKRYRLQSAPSPAGPWTSVGSWIKSNNPADITFPAQNKSGDKAFYRIAVQDIDSDSDGVSDWAERQLEGFNPNAADSFSSGQANADLSAAEAWLDSLSGGNVQVNSALADAFEKENTPASFTITRSAPMTQPFTLFLRQASASSASVGRADNTDFQLKNASGVNIVDRVVIPAGQASVDVLIHPVLDVLPEVPEEVHFSIGGSNAMLAGRICDATATPSNDKLLVAYLSPRSGVSTVGSGIATILLRGDNDSSTITVNFSNLGSVANGAHLETSNGINITSIPPFRYSGQIWNIRATQNLTTNQQVLDQLLSGGFRLNVESQLQPTGEIRGFFKVVNGSTDFVEPPAAPAIETLTGDALDRDIVCFLTQATFGARWEDIVAMRTKITAKNGDRIAAFREWIDEQALLPAPSHTDLSASTYTLGIEAYNTGPLATGPNPRREAWWTIALNSQDQLRQRMTYALSQIFVMSEKHVAISAMPQAVASYYDALQRNSFGTYRQLIEDVTKHPSMGSYLSHLQNQKTQIVNGVTVSTPDENYAREIMQLFSIGLVKLHPDGSLVLGQNGLPMPTYGQNDIIELAKVFTGWAFSKNHSGSETSYFFTGSGFAVNPHHFKNPMKVFHAYHDEGAKSFLGKEIPARVNGGDQDLADTLDHLAGHPNTAPFICHLLIQRLTTSNPSSGYVRRVAKKFQDSGGDFLSTIKEILLDPEARNLTAANNEVGRGKPKEPLIRHCSLLRALGAKTAIPLALLKNYGYPETELNKFPPQTSFVRYRDTNDLSQVPFGAPSVFNWYRPDYAPHGGLSENGFVSPELELMTEATIFRALNYHYTPLYSTTGQSTTNLHANVNIADIPNFTSYDNNSDNINFDFTPLRALYLSVLDTNNDGLFSSTDTTWASRATKIPEAVTLVLDRIDLLLCGGSLKARFGDTLGKPRRIILDALLSIRSGFNNTSGEQNTSMNMRIQDAIYLVMKTPDFSAQK
jgi:uncharacterized protein (DUF1800 family)